MIGCKVESTDHIPEGLVGKEIPSGKFIKFVARGEMPKAVMNTWMEIWDQDHVLKRKYTADYEIYGKSSYIPENPEVEIYIAV